MRGRQMRYRMGKKAYSEPTDFIFFHIQRSLTLSYYSS